MKCRSCGKELGAGQDICSECFGDPFKEIREIRKRSKIWISPWPRGQPDFDKDKMKNKINLGVIRTFGHRAVPVINFLMILMVWLDIPSRWWSLAGLSFVALLYVFFDWKLIFSQEQELYFKKNPEFQRWM